MTETATQTPADDTLSNDERLSVADPYDLFGTWMALAEQREPNDPTAMTLATVGADGRPSARTVLLKGLDSPGSNPRGFVFYTNTHSRKGQDLTSNADVALLFHWKSLRRQIRIEGRSQPVDPAEADAYFATRPLGSQMGAWASDQSRPMAGGRGELERRVKEYEDRFGSGPVPRPPHWSGYRVVPDRMEFWIDQRYRLHDRALFTVADGRWSAQRLFP